MEKLEPEFGVVKNGNRQQFQITFCCKVCGMTARSQVRGMDGHKTIKVSTSRTRTLDEAAKECAEEFYRSGLDSKSMNGSVRFAVDKCASSSQDSRLWTELDVSRATAAASAVTRASAQAKGKEIAGSAEVGAHVIAQTRSDDTDQFALGVFVDAGKGSPGHRASH